MRRLLLVLVAACSSSHPSHAPDAAVDAAPPIDPLAPVSGTRIRAQRLTTTDGLSAPIGLYDTLLQQACRVATADDGVLRCLPSSAALTDSGFADAQCTTPVAAVAHGCAAPAYVITSDNAACGAHEAVYQTGAQSTSLYYTDSMGRCVSTPPTGVEDFYARATHIAADTFASFTLQTMSLAPGIAADFWIGADGSRFWTGQLRDAANRTCTVELASDGTPRCLPEATQAFAGFDYADDTCTIPIARATGTTCPDTAALAMVYASTTTCSAPQLGVAELGPAFTGTTYTKLGGTCHANGTGMFFQLGQALDPAMFPAATPSSAGGTRITFQTSVLAGVAVHTSYFYTDHQLGEDCAFETAADGVQRCLPSNDASYAYRDASCTQPVAFIQTGGACPAPAIHYAYKHDATCAGAQHLFTLGAQLATAPQLYDFNGNGQCVTLGGGTIAVYELGAEVAPSTFAQGTIVTD